MDLALLLKGLVIGFSIAAPVGPIGILCIQRTLARGRLAGFASGLGAATADALYGVIAGFGLTLLSSMLVASKEWLQLVGGVFLLYLGVRIILMRPASQSVSTSSMSVSREYLSTLFLTLTNPTTILSFIAIFAGVGVGASAATYGAASIFVLGVFTGSALWWLILTTITHLLRSRIGERGLRLVNVIAGVIVLVFGIVAILSFTSLANG